MTDLFWFMLPYVIYLGLPALGLGLVWLVTEFRVVRGGGESFDCIYWIWNNVPWVRKVRW